MSVLRSFSYGGGVQSTAALVLASQGKLPSEPWARCSPCFHWDVFIFANVGEQAEKPATLRYVEEVAKPFAAQHGIELVEVRKTLRDGTHDDLYEAITSGRRDQPIPVKGDNGAPLSRSCTAEWKIRTIAKELIRRGASDDDGRRAIVGMGITVDEIRRAKHWGGVDPGNPEQILHYPLLTLRLRRLDCHSIITDAGLPLPPRSACWFCPNSSMDAWRHLKRTDPDRFAKAVALEENFNRVNAEKDRRPVWMTRYGRPLDDVVADQLVLDTGDEDDGCVGGYCHT